MEEILPILLNLIKEKDAQGILNSFHEVSVSLVLKPKILQKEKRKRKRNQSMDISQETLNWVLTDLIQQCIERITQCNSLGFIAGVHS